MNGAMEGNGFWSDFTTWAAHPFSRDMDLKHYALLVGLTMILIVLWSVMLRHLFGALQGD